ncbi:MAG: glycosyltransferase family 1 protein, partial [Parafilimonas terrae]|nr:glycosyltransferase family 1 protein [Parafilimonas terrae]
MSDILHLPLDRAAIPADRRPLRVALVQTQAENAGAQQISRLVSRGLEQRGHEVRQVFFFRRTSSFDDVDNAVTCWPERPSGVLGLARFLLRFRAVLRRMKPDVVITFQHFGNLI